MNQLSFDFLSTNPLVETAERIRNFPSQTPSLESFIYELGTHMYTRDPGDLLIAGIPDIGYVDRVVHCLSNFFAPDRSSRSGTSNLKVVGIEVPHLTNAKAQHKMLANSYAGFPVSELKGKHTPQFVLNFSNAAFEQNPLQNICGLISNRSAEYYAVKNGHCLVPANATTAEVVTQIRFFSQLARDSGKTHVIFVSTGVALGWREIHEVQCEATFLFHKPFRDVDCAASERSSHCGSNFIGWIKAYDAAIPCMDGFKISDHHLEIHKKVFGCPFRLHRWLRDAVLNAISNKKDVLSWENFKAMMPSAGAQGAASNEYQKMHQEMPSWYSSARTTPSDDVIDASGAADQVVLEKQVPARSRKKLKPGELTPKRVFVNHPNRAPAA